MSGPAIEPRPARARRTPSDVPFFLILGVLSGSYVLLLAGMLLADLVFTVTPKPGLSAWDKLGSVARSLATPEIRYSIRLSLISCTVTTILSLAVAIPIGYLMARFTFPGQKMLDALLDIPIVLPPLVIGLSLLILFQTGAGKQLEFWAGAMVVPAAGLVAWLLRVAGGLLGGVAGILAALALPRSRVAGRGSGLVFFLVQGAVLGMALGHFGGRFAADIVELVVPQDPPFTFTFSVPGVILAQFMVACAFAVRTMMATFEQINPRQEQVALTLGCSRRQAFWRVVLPEARRGVLTAATLAWARSLGEFGPILVFAGTTRLKTEVLPSTVFLELTVGNIEAAVAVSLLMVAIAVGVLIVVRGYGVRSMVGGRWFS